MTSLTHKALEIADRFHKGQERKGGVTFITHPITVASIVSQHTDDEDIVAAAVLHDTIEDTDYTAKEMKADFNDRVTEFVLGVTIPEMDESTNKKWTSSREGYIENLKRASMESGLIAAADKIHNFSSTVAQYKDTPEEFLKDFKGKKEDRIMVYQAIVDVIQNKLEDHPLAQKLQHEWSIYKAFVESL